MPILRNRTVNQENVVASAGQRLERKALSVFKNAVPLVLEEEEVATNLDHAIDVGWSNPSRPTIIQRRPVRQLQDVTTLLGAVPPKVAH
jgi:hypothetical protein